jgi:hypothetical protein
MCKELGVYNYMQFYYVIPGCDLSDGLRYLSTDSHISKIIQHMCISGMQKEKAKQ